MEFLKIMLNWKERVFQSRARVVVVRMTITLTIRIIKSFEYRNSKNIILHVDPALTVSQLKEEIRNNLPKAFVGIPFDTCKIYVKAHGTKTSNLIINMDDDQMLDDQLILADQGTQSS